MSASSGPDIVQDGLVLCLDAANRKSYSGSGTVCSDLTNNGYNGTLVNTPTFNTANGGFFSFNGTNNRIDLSSSFNTFGAGLGNGFTVSVWLKTTTTTNSTLFATTNTGFGNLIFACNLNRGVGGRDNSGVGATQFYIRSQTSGLFLVGYILTNIYNGRWNNLVWQFNGGVNFYNIYVNGILQSVTYTDTQTPNTFVNFDFPLPIGADNSRGTLQRYGAFDLAQILFCRRGLNSTEILQNYNALKGRFQLT